MRMDQNDVVMRILLVVDAIYMMVSFRKPGKYKMTPSQVENSQFPILLWIYFTLSIFFHSSRVIKLRSSEYNNVVLKI